MDTTKEKERMPREDKPKKKTNKQFSKLRCYEPGCSVILKIYDNLDPDTELARHRHSVHQVPLPVWAQDDDHKNWKEFKNSRFKKH